MKVTRFDPSADLLVVQMRRKLDVTVHVAID